jgi:hypothetical protein
MTSTLLKAGALKFNPLEDATMDEVLPAAWNGSHVATRIADAFNTLSRLPTASARAALGFWPSYAYTWEDMLAQLEQAADEQAREHRIANRVRITPDLVEVSQMERALCWPMDYLANEPRLARAVNAMAFTHAIGCDVVWLARKKGGDPDLWQRKHWAGCALIAQGLTQDKVRVF